MFEKRLALISPRSFTANGTADGRVTVADTDLFRVKQQVIITATGQPNLELEVKRVIDETTMFVGPRAGNIDSRSDISLYTTAAGAAISANEQTRPKIPEQEVERITYEEEPVVARRVVMVDKLGRIYDDGNPLPIAFDGTISVGNVTIQDDDGDELAINNDGSLNVNIVSSPSSSPGLDVTHNEVSAVASGVETTLISMVTPPAGRKIYNIEVSGENIALFRVKINGTTMSSKRTFFGGNLNETFSFQPHENGLELVSGDVLQVSAIHQRPMSGNFEVTVMALNL